MGNIISKIAKCKEEIRKSPPKKDGKNNFSNYEYFTPGQVESLVFESCEKQGLMTKFDLIRNEFGITGQLSIIDIETGEKEIYMMATDIPEIKATNIAQQLGGCMTYTERYLKQSAFGIIDNSLDFDTTENTEKRQSEKVTEWLSEENYKKALESDFKGIQATINYYSGNGKGMKKEYRIALLNKLQKLKNQ